MMLIMRRGPALLAAALTAAIVAAAGCSDHGAKPNTSSASVGATVSTSAPTSARPSPSPTNPYPADVPLTGHNVKPGEKPPLYPAAAKVRSQAGANAFAEFFMRTLDWMYATTNPAYPKHYFAASCGLCKGLTTGMTKTAALHHYYEGGRFTLYAASGTQIAPVTAPADYCASIKVDTTAAAVVDHTGKIFNGDGAHAGLAFKICMTLHATWQTTYLARL